MSSMQSAPATIPATRAATFAPAARRHRPAPSAGSSASSRSPARSANASTGTKPAADTRFGSSNTADRTGPHEIVASDEMPFVTAESDP